MSDNLPEKPNSEEVDLGQLFKLIGNAFQKLIDFITSIFKGIYHVILVLLIHVFKRIKWYAVAGFLGLAIGYALDKTSEKVYGANSVIETNFGSEHQIYENLKYLNQLAFVNNDSIELARKLNISIKDAASIKDIYMEPYIDENDLIKMFADFRKDLDSVSRENYKYEDYIESINFFSFKRHQIEVVSTDRFVFQKLNENLINVLVDNTYLDELKNVEIINFESEKKTIDTQKREIDSLAIEYLKIRKNESNKEPTSGSGTNLYMGNAQQNQLLVDESKLLAKKVELEAKKRQINVDLVKNERVVNVISEFPDAGYDISEWTDKLVVRLPILFFIITFFGFILFGLGKYLSEQDKKLNQQ